jgi:ribonucleoside-diphosphate reductase alpha chain
VQLGTPFAVTQECDAHPEFKRVLAEARDEDMVEFTSVAGLPARARADVLLEKYAKGTESSAEDIHHRVSIALAAVEQPAEQARWQARFLDALARGFIPAGRINSAGGTDIRATLINCFVQPVGDSVSEDVAGKPSIYKALAQAAETMRRGGGVGYDFSRIRPRGAMVKGTHSNASGPVSYMRVFDRSCETVESAGARRGAQMGILRCDHPDLDEFIHAKDDNGLRTSTSRSASPMRSCRPSKTTPNSNWCTRHNRVRP